MEYNSCIACGKPKWPYQRKTEYCSRCYQLSKHWELKEILILLDLKNRAPISREDFLYLASSRRPALDINIPHDKRILFRTIHHLGGKLAFKRWGVAKHQSSRSMAHTKSRKLYLGEKCELCGVVNQLVVHHKVPLSWGGNVNKENTITLCEICHLKTHNILKSVLSPRFRTYLLSLHLSEIETKLQEIELL